MWRRPSSSYLPHQRRIEGDVLVGTDGIWSKIRKQMVGDTKPHYSEYTVYTVSVCACMCLRACFAWFVGHQPLPLPARSCFELIFWLSPSPETGHQRVRACPANIELVGYRVFCEAFCELISRLCILSLFTGYQ